MEWALIWDAVSAISAMLSFFVLAAAACFTYGLVKTTGDTAKTTLTIQVLDSQGITRASNVSRRFLAEAEGDLNAVRSLLNEANSDFETKNDEKIRTVLGAYRYLARLYTLGVLDNRLLIDSAYLYIAYTIYALNPLIVRELKAGLLNDSDLNLGRACLERMAKIPRPYFTEILQAWGDLPAPAPLGSRVAKSKSTP